MWGGGGHKSGDKEKSRGWVIRYLPCHTGKTYLCSQFFWGLAQKGPQFKFFYTVKGGGRWSWNSNPLATWCEDLTPWKRTRCWERLRAGGEGDDRGGDGWMASPTPWTWVWVSSRSWWWTGRPGVLQSMGSQGVGHDWATELIFSSWPHKVLIAFSSK